MNPHFPLAAFAIAAASLALSLQAMAAPVTFGTILSGANESPPQAVARSGHGPCRSLDRENGGGAGDRLRRHRRAGRG